MPANADEMRPRKTYYYQKKDGTIFACNESEARLIHSKYNQFGVSDGTVFLLELEKAVKEQNKALDKIGDPKRRTAAWKKKRVEIATKARKALLRAQEKDKESAKGKTDIPSAWNGMQGVNNPMAARSINRLIF